MPEPAHEPTLLDVEDVGSRSSTSVKTGPPGSPKVYIALAAILAGVIGWSVISSSDADGADDVAPSTSVAEVVGDLEDEIGGTFDPEPDPELDESPPLDELPPFDEMDSFDPLAPGSGLTLLANMEERGLVSLDLDTGDATEFGYPVDEFLLQTDEYVIIRHYDSGRHSAVALDDLAATPLIISRNTWVVSAKEGEDETIVSFLTRVDDEENGQMYTEMAIDLDIETIINRGSLTDHHPSLASLNRLHPNGDLITGATGGVYESVGPNYERVADGRLLAFDDEFAIIEECDDALICETSWVTRADWQPVDRPLPVEQFNDGVILGAGRVLVYLTPSSENFRAFDVAAGTEIDISLTTVKPAVSGDGQWIAVLNNGGAIGVLNLQNLDTGETASLFGPFDGPIALMETSR